ncbi:MAG: tol-pal system-associated acyl-CoA thioesterase [Burkholderiales bacterium]|nr:tol-pal system-associated acyl-CoA thioesterase [Burkholderiales bacterium]MDE2299508.1 tol-pal system-associated acyl-CoA thioesterase [Burkholderiales bacterium]MDE2627438.1 tol-pal system-associated acyl-CoA thioesterase [Burkholderiales bacterium]
MPAPLAPPYRFRLRVYWEDTDAGGVVFYANYLKFFERARTEWLRSLGHSQERLRTDTGVVFVVTDTAVRYVRPARLDDELAVTVRVVHAGRAQMTIAQQAWRHATSGEELVADGTIRIGCVEAGTFKPQRIPISIVDSLAPPAPTTMSRTG